MGEKIIVGPVNKGLRNDREPFVIDNDSFPSLINAYQWRGRIKRKRGTSLLGRLERFFNSASTSYNSGSTTITLGNDGSGNGTGDLFIGYSLQSNATLVSGSIMITDTTSGDVYTDPNSNGVLVGTPAGSGTINYNSGEFLITGAAGHLITATFLYYPDLPVMGLEDFYVTTNAFPGTIAFDTTYSYNIITPFPYNIYDVSFYKNPPISASLPGYVQKTTVTPTTWNGQDYQQFWTVNFQGALWATNGINIPFTTANIGMQFNPITGVTITAAGPPAIVVLTIAASGLVIGDFVFLNEIKGMAGINFQTGYVTNVIGSLVTVELPNATVSGVYLSGGIAQYLTNRSSPTIDCLRWYDGDPTNGSATNPLLTGNLGWVNFMPPLSQNFYSIAELPAAQYYLVGARVILPFKDRLLFFGPVVQSSAVPANPIYLQDTVIYSQNGTPYYTASYTNTPLATADTPTSATNVFNPILVPAGQTATSPAYFEDSTGFGGFITAGLDQPIITVAPNEDVLIIGFNTFQTRLVYSGNDIVPFNFFITNSELGSASTFSQITMDEGVITRGTRGYVLTSQVKAQRVDLDIPDAVFEVNLQTNGNERFCSQRDFINEWIYFTYPDDEISYKFPNQTLQYNYRDESWAIFNECYTTYGTFRKQTGFTWATVGTVYPTWSDWNEPWSAGISNLLQPEIIGGNQQGFILIRDQGTGEGNSLYIGNFSFPVMITGATQAAQAVLTAVNQFIPGQLITITGVVGMTQLNGRTFTITATTPTTITIAVNSTGFTPYVSGGVATPVEPIYSPNHCLNNGDYIIISGAIGTVGAVVNNQIFSVANPTTNGFSLNAATIPTSGTYFGNALIERLYVPFIQTKQFPVSWGIGRKTRLGPQQYLFSTTSTSQITLLIFLSQDGDNAYNDLEFIYSPGIVPSPSENNSLIYSTVLFTCPESTNLGLTPANTNLNIVTAPNQQQIWHRTNTSLLGDTVQVGFTMNDTQMRALTPTGNSFVITGATNANPCVLTCAGNFAPGQLIQITNVIGMSQLNFNPSINNNYSVISSNATTVTINVNSTAFGTYSSGGSAIVVSPLNQTAEIELHGFILDVSPSMVLA